MERPSGTSQDRSPRWNTVYRDNPGAEHSRWVTAPGMASRANPSSLDDDTRQKLHEGTAALSRTSASLSRSIQVAEETEVIGAEVAGELGDQRETLLRTRQRLEDVNQDLSRTRRLLRTMYVRVIANKFILVFLILLEIVIVICQVYLKFFTH